MFSLFFINRPIFSWVVAILFMGAGILAAFNLPVQQYPEIAAPEVSIRAIYPGATAQTLDTTVTQIIEQNLTGIDNLRYFSSVSSADGSVQITVTFETGTDPDIAQVQTQNKVSESLPRLPSQVQQLGISVQKSNQTNSLIAAFYSKNGEISQEDIGDYIASNIVEDVSRVDGVGQVTAFSPEHSLRIWLNPDKLYYYRVTALEVLEAVRSQNNQLASGQIGGAPILEGQQITASIISRTLMSDPSQFRNIILRTLPDGSSVTVGDVARVEIGVENYATIRRFNRHPAAGFGVSLNNDANALETIEAVKKRIESFRPNFPADLDVAYPVDVSPFISLSVQEVIKTLVIAVVLVLLTMFVFLQSWRSTLVPGIAIPVVLLGTFAALSAIGYTINILTLFAIVLSIGLLVDDEIVVTENVKRLLDENPEMDPKEAAKSAMKELWGALVGTTVVLWAVFAPMAFLGGATGVIYRQFSLTVIAAMTISLFIALSFCPSLAGSILKRSSNKKEFVFYRWFNSAYTKTASFYEKLLRAFLSYFKTGLVSFALLVAATFLILSRIPEAFLPEEDQGRVFALIEGPANATFERMLAPVKEVEDFFLTESKAAVDSLFTVMGFSFSGRGQNTATAFVNFKDYEKREGEENSVFSIRENALKAFAELNNVRVTPITPPAISELGNASGFEFQLVDQGRVGREMLLAARDKIIELAIKHPLVSYARINALKDEPQYKIDIDYKKAQAYGLRVPDINNTLSAAWGGMYVNDYIEQNRVKRVYVQGEALHRMRPDDLSRWYVRSLNGQMVSFADFAQGSWIHGPPQVQRFNGSSSVEIQGEAAPGASTGQAMEAISKLSEKLPKGISLEWTGLSFEEQAAGNQVLTLYTISILAIFLSLVALYESWLIPFSIMLNLPIGIFGAALFVWVAGLSNDIYFKVGFLLSMGLAAKNAILIVEFALIEIEKGKEVLEATVNACVLRFRPILMTSLTFMLGVLPLVLASGPSSGAQNSIGTSLLGGITAITLLTIFFAPLFFLGIMRLKEKYGPAKGGTS